MNLVVGFGVTGRAVASALARRGADVVALDDRPDDSVRSAAAALGIPLWEAPDGARLAALVASAERIVPTPGLPEQHPVFALARQRGATIVSEFDLAREWDSRPIAAITGTDGKTTVTTMVTEMLRASGVRATAAGNVDVPLVIAIDDVDVDVFVVEASSFRLGHTRRFAPQVATWLNFAPDHLDVHATVESYEAAKAAIFRDLGPGEHAVANADDPVVMRHVPRDAPTLTFGTSAGADYRVVDGVLAGEGTELLPERELWRSMPHDVANSLAAAATARHAGASVEGVRTVLRSFGGLHHRVELVGEWDGIRWFDDSKATTPHAVHAALTGLDRVVLIAGGWNKGLDFGELALVADRVVALVAIGRDADDVAQVFRGHRPVVQAASMRDAVRQARALARSGDVVLLSPGCASFDWYRDYRERGDDFARAVVQLNTGGAA